MGLTDWRLVACDLDGTLLRSDGTLDARTVRTLAEIQRAGLRFVICTARPPRWLAPIAASTGRRGVAICANGAALLDLQAGTLLDATPLSAAAARSVVARLTAAFPEGAFAVEWVDGFGRDARYRTHWPQPADTVVAPIETLLRRPVIKLLLRQRTTGADVDATLRAAQEAIGPLAEVTHSSTADVLLEISAPGVTKAAALAGLCARRGIGAEQVVAFGDMPNDLAMLRWAGYAVAVANAHPDVLAIADEVTASNDEAGVAQVLERWMATPPARL